MNKSDNLKDNINLEKIPAYNNIIKAKKDIENSYFFKHYDLTISELINITKIQNEKIKKIFTDEENILLEELLKFSDKKEYNLMFVKNIKIESKLKVLNYMYWQYKLIDTSKKIDLAHLKKILNIKNGIKYIKPVEIDSNCKICGEKATIFINSYNRKEDISFKCTKCEHEEKVYKEYIFPIRCGCSLCENLNDSFFRTLKNNFNGLLQGIQEQTEKFYNKMEDDELITDREMEIDYKIYRSEMDREIREIMSYNPEDKKELLLLIEKLAKRNYKYDKNYTKRILEKLFNLRIIYSVLSKESLDTVKLYVINTFVHEYCRNTENPITNILDLFDKYDTLDKFKMIAKYENDRIFFENHLQKYEFLLDGNLMWASWYNPIYKEDLIINKYYFMNSNLKSFDNKKHLKNIFNSEKEKSIYIRLKNKYSRYIVCPNLKASNMIDINGIKKYLLKEEFEYLEKCNFNFVLFDLEGNPLKVIQLDKGIHHDKSEWKKKDDIKRKICEVLAIDFEVVY